MPHTSVRLLAGLSLILNASRERKAIEVPRTEAEADGIALNEGLLARSRNDRQCTQVAPGNGSPKSSIAKMHGNAHMAAQPIDERACSVGQMKILHGPVNVGNQPWVLSRAERRLGASSDLVIRSQTWLKYPADRVLSSEGARFIEVAMRSMAYGLRSQWQYDVLHFYFGQTFLSPGFPLSKPGLPFSKNAGLNNFLNRLTTIDLHVARLLGKKLFMTLQGCDVRLAQEGNRRNEWTMCAHGRCAMYQRCVDALDARRHFLISHILPLFDRVLYLNPEHGHLVPDGTFLPYASAEIDKFKLHLPASQGRPRIVHAPTDTGIKGTPMILEALKQLQSKYDFELILVENMPHSEALELYRSASVAIDQVLGGWYGGFAVEMMAMGKPVACYIRDIDMKFIPEAMRRELPVFNIRPGHLVEDIAAILEQRSGWETRGRESRKFVERWHNPDLIAKAMVEAYVRPDSKFELDPDRP
jgi:hypothetical protein